MADKSKNGLFSKIASASDAAKTIRDAAFAFFFVAALQGAIGAFIAPRMLLDAVLLTVLAGALLIWRSRVAALLLLVVALLQASSTVLNRLGVASEGGTNIILAGIVLVTAFRAVEATFKWHGKYRDQQLAVH